MKKNFWIGPFYGSDLDNDYISSEFPTIPAVYIWRRIFKNIPESIFNKTNFIELVEKSLIPPFVSISKAKVSRSEASNSEYIRSNFIRFEKIEIGGGRLSIEKSEYLNSLDTISKRKNIFDELFNSCLNFGPVLYVGETDNLNQRIIDHKNGRSLLLNGLIDLGLHFDEVALSYLPLKVSTQKERKFIESILTILLLAPLTKRIG